MTKESTKTPPPSLAHGRAVLQSVSRDLPSTPGVYRMIDADGVILYIGKAKHLKNRVSSYVNLNALTTRIQAMISRIATVEIITTRSEAEALLLEANLIKKHMPRYNILLKDDKSFPYILFGGEHEYARLSKHRGAKSQKGKYFGPFVSAGAVNETITLLQKAFLLRTCTDSFFKNRSRPCMLYQIKQCSAPCVHYISKDDYAGLVSEASDFLSGKSRQIQDALVQKMQAHSLKLEFEKARVIRDRIKALTKVQQQSALVSSSVVDADIIALAREGDHCCVQLFSFRGGRNYGNKSWYPVHVESHSDSEILERFIAHIYQLQPPPGLILTSVLLEESTLIEDALRLNTSYKVDITYPLRGDKRTVMQEAMRNANEALQRHLTMSATQRTVLEGLQKLFELEKMPERIEVYDNSHISGTHALGAMIVAGPAGYLKQEYRKYNIKNTEIPPGDDYGMMREVLTRRFRAIGENATEVDAHKIPDLVLLDGGAGQLGIATEVFEELGISTIPYAAIAKGPDRNAGREQFFVPGKAPFQLPKNDKILHALQRMRDEAHRFAIGGHRNKRSKAIVRSELDSIASVGPSRKRALLLHFGSAKEVAAASLDDITKVPGISTAMAKLIYDHFHA